MRKLTQVIKKVNAEVIGLDVHSRLIVFSHLNRRGDEVACGSISSSREALEQLLEERVGRNRPTVRALIVGIF